MTFTQVIKFLVAIELIAVCVIAASALFVPVDIMPALHTLLIVLVCGLATAYPSESAPSKANGFVLSLIRTISSVLFIPSGRRNAAVIHSGIIISVIISSLLENVRV